MNITKYGLRLYVKEDATEYNVLGQEINQPEVLARLFTEVFDLANESEEVLTIFALDVRNTVIGAFEVARGVLDATVTHPREVFKRLITLNASRFVVAHNHPSGNCHPSPEDCKFTLRLKDCGELIGINLLDSLIVVLGGNYYSFRQHMWEDL